MLPTASLPGYPDVGTIEIQFRFPEYVADGYVYGVNTLCAYLPNNTEGTKVLRVSVLME